MSTPRAVLADGNSLARRSASQLLASAGVVVLAETGDGLEAVRLCERHQPDLLVGSLRLPGLDAPQALRSLPPGQRPLALLVTARVDGATLLDALAAGARGFVHESVAAAELAPAAQFVADGGYWLRPPLCADVFATAAALAAHLSADPMAALSEREREVFLLAARGVTNPEIGPLLHISPRTVEAHRTRAFRKLGLGSLREAIRFAARRGLLLED